MHIGAHVVDYLSGIESYFQNLQPQFFFLKNYVVGLCSYTLTGVKFPAELSRILEQKTRSILDERGVYDRLKNCFFYW